MPGGAEACRARTLPAGPWRRSGTLPWLRPHAKQFTYVLPESIPRENCRSPRSTNELSGLPAFRVLGCGGFRPRLGGPSQAHAI